MTISAEDVFCAGPTWGWPWRSTETVEGLANVERRESPSEPADHDSACNGRVIALGVSLFRIGRLFRPLRFASSCAAAGADGRAA